jgi:NADPH2:quinone reductase
MKAAWYDRQGPAADVLVVGELPMPMPGPGEVRIRIAASSINPGDVKKRQDAFGCGMPFPRIVPHSDGAGTVDAVGAGVEAAWIGRRVWCHGAQTYRPFGTAADYTVVPLQNVMPLPENASFAQGACLGIPGITAHRAVHVAGPVAGKTVLVTGAAGAVGQCALQLALHAGARVIAACRSAADVDAAVRAGAHAGVLLDDGYADRVRTITPDGVDHIVEVAFSENAAANTVMLAQGGAIASYASGSTQPVIDFWPLLFMNARLYFVGSDDVPPEDKEAACAAMNGLFDAGWRGPAIAAELPLARIAEAHQLVEQGGRRGRIVLVDPDGA